MAKLVDICSGIQPSKPSSLNHATIFVRLTESSSITGTTTYAYDANGSQTLKHSAAGDTLYTWDLRGHMVAIDTNHDHQAEVTYQYDAEGTRVAESTIDRTANTTTTTQYLNDKDNPTGYAKAVEEKTQTTGQAAQTRSYLIGQQVIGQSDANGLYYLQVDGHGSTRALLNSSGQVATVAGVPQTYSYDAYGKLLNMDATSAKTNWLFGGDGIYDVNSGWTYHLARWRDGDRFVSYDSFEADPTSPASLHKYLYVGCNPTLGQDPTGYENLTSQQSAMFITLKLFAAGFHTSLAVHDFGMALSAWSSAREAAELGEDWYVAAGYALAGSLYWVSGSYNMYAAMLALLSLGAGTGGTTAGGMALSSAAGAGATGPQAAAAIWEAAVAVPALAERVLTSAIAQALLAVYSSSVTGRPASGAPSSRRGSSSSEPGKWVPRSKNSMSDNAEEWELACGGKPGKSYLVEGGGQEAEFDARDLRGRWLIDAKSKRYTYLMQQYWYSGNTQMIDEARRQVRVAASQGWRVKWICQDPQSVSAINQLLNDNGVTGVEVTGPTGQ